MNRASRRLIFTGGVGVAAGAAVIASPAGAAEPDTTIKFRRGPRAEWSEKNPILALGEPGFEIDTDRHKIGDGARTWSELPYFVSEEQIAATYVRFRDTDGNPIAAGFVTITVDIDSGRIDDILFEEG